MRHALRLFVLGFALCLAACAPNPLQQTLVALVRGDLGQGESAVATAVLNPAYRYLRVELDGAAPALLVLGYLEPHPDGVVEVWYASLGEVIKTQNGRIVGTVGLGVDWASVTFSKPPVAWQGGGGLASTYVRVRSELPGYRVGGVETVAVSPLARQDVGQLPLKSFGPVFQVAQAQRLHWYQERVVAAPPTSDLPVSWFAVGRHGGQVAVVFSRQCLTDNMCMNLQPWPAQDEAFKP